MSDYYLFIPTKQELHLVLDKLEELACENPKKFEKSLLFTKMFAFSGLRLAEMFHFDFNKHIIEDVGKYGSIKLFPVKCDCSHCKRRKRNYWEEYDRKSNTNKIRYKKRLSGYWTPKSDESEKAIAINKPLYDIITDLRRQGITKVKQLVGSYDTLEYHIRKINKYLPKNYPNRKKLTPHNLRRYFISQSLDKYRDSINASRLARHKSPATTKLYARPIDGLGEDLSYADL